MDCPVCKINLLMAEKQGVEIDYCPQCRGIWLDRGELEKIIDRSRALTQQYNLPQQSPEPQRPLYQEQYQHPQQQQQYQQDKYHKKSYKKRDNPFEEIFDIFDFG